MIAIEFTNVTIIAIMPTARINKQFYGLCHGINLSIEIISSKINYLAVPVADAVGAGVA